MHTKQYGPPSERLAGMRARARPGRELRKDSMSRAACSGAQPRSAASAARPLPYSRPYAIALACVRCAGVTCARAENALG